MTELAGVNMGDALDRIARELMRIGFGRAVVSRGTLLVRTGVVNPAVANAGGVTIRWDVRVIIVSVGDVHDLGIVTNTVTMHPPWHVVATNTGDCVMLCDDYVQALSRQSAISRAESSGWHHIGGDDVVKYG